MILRHVYRFQVVRHFQSTLWIAKNIPFTGCAQPFYSFRSFPPRNVIQFFPLSLHIASTFRISRWRCEILHPFSGILRHPLASSGIRPVYIIAWYQPRRSGKRGLAWAGCLCVSLCHEYITSYRIVDGDSPPPTFRHPAPLVKGVNTKYGNIMPRWYQLRRSARRR